MAQQADVRIYPIDHVRHEQWNCPNVWYQQCCKHKAVNVAQSTCCQQVAHIYRLQGDLKCRDNSFRWRSSWWEEWQLSSIGASSERQCCKCTCGITMLCWNAHVVNAAQNIRGKQVARTHIEMVFIAETTSLHKYCCGGENKRSSNPYVATFINRCYSVPLLRLARLSRRMKLYNVRHSSRSDVLNMYGCSRGGRSAHLRWFQCRQKWVSIIMFVAGNVRGAVTLMWRPSSTVASSVRRRCECARGKHSAEYTWGANSAHAFQGVYSANTRVSLGTLWWRKQAQK